MKRLLFVLLPVLALSVPARADHIALFSEPDSDFCAKDAPPFVVTTVYVVHVATDGSSGSSWRIDNTSSLLALGSSCAGLSINGDPFTGVYVPYSTCRSGTFVICQLNFMNVSTTPAPGCYHLRVMPYPGEQTVIAVDCNDTPTAASGGWFTFDAAGKQPPCDDCTTPVESSTWGRVKSLYR